MTKAIELSQLGSVLTVTEASNKVGINKTNPSAFLHVVGADYQTLRLENSDDGANGPYLELYNNSASPADDDYTGIISFKNNNSAAEEITYSQIRAQSVDVTDGTEDGILTFHTRAAGAFGERLRIASAGQVGIGTDNPIFKLQLNHADEDGILLKAANTAASFINFSDGDDNDVGQISYDHATNHLALRVNASEKLRLTSDGKLILSGTQRTTPFISGDGGMCIEQSFDGNLRALTIRNKDTDAAAATSMCFSLNRSGGDQDFTAGEIKLVKEQAWTTTSSTVGGAMVFSTIGSGTMGERARITSVGQMILGTASNLGTVPPKFTIVNNTNSSTFSECQLLRLNGPSGVGERGGIGFHYAQSLDYGEKPSSFIGIETVAAGGAQQTDLIFATRPNTNNHEPTERVRITSAGDVGIGTNNPSHYNNYNTLTINGTNGGELDLYRNGTLSADLFSNSGGFYFSTREASNRPIVWQLHNGSSVGERMRLEGSGNLGIGTNDPVTLLHLENGHTKQTLKSTNLNTASSIIFDVTNVNTKDFLLGQLAGKWNGNDVAYINFEAGQNETNKDDGVIAFLTRLSGSGGPVERMRIDYKGRVIVGALPAADENFANARLWVNGYDNVIISEGNSTGWTEGAFKCVAPNNSRGGGIFMFNSNGSGTTNQWFAGRPYSSSDQYIIARSTGMNVATQSTAQTSNALFTIASSGNAVLSGTLTESGSDDKLKKDRTPLTSALEKVKTLEGFTYNWNDDAINTYGFPSDEGTLVGMSAQELQAVLPEAVKTVSQDKEVSDPTAGEAGEKQEYLTIQYGRVVPLLVEAIKELSAENAALRSRLDSAGL